MTAQKVLTELRNLGVLLEVEGEELRFRARKGVLTPELLTALSENKGEILRLLNYSESAKPESKPDAEQSAPLPISKPEATAPDAYPTGNGWSWYIAEGKKETTSERLCEWLTEANLDALMILSSGKLWIGTHSAHPIPTDLLNSVIQHGEAVAALMRAAGLKDSYCPECGQMLRFEREEKNRYTRAVCVGKFCGLMRIW